MINKNRTRDQPRANGMAINTMECEEFGDYLLDKGLHEDVVSNIVAVIESTGYCLLVYLKVTLRSWLQQLEIEFISEKS